MARERSAGGKDSHTLPARRSTGIAGKLAESHVVEADGAQIRYRLVRRKTRKRTAIVIDPHIGVEVRAPLGAALRDIEQLVRAKAQWIRHHLDDIARQAPSAQAYVTGDTILFGGERVSLQVEEGPASCAGCTLNGRCLHVRVGPVRDGETRRQRVRDLLRSWLGDQALERARRRVPAIAQQVGVQPNRIRIGDMKTRWGSCSGKGNISLNYRLIMAPPAAMDYLIAHELCHMLEPNHSPAYWEKVARVVPDYSQMRKWLRDNRLRLEL